MTFSELSEKIEQWLNEFIIDEKNSAYIRNYAKELRLLPLYEDWFNCLAIRADGEIFKFSTDDEHANPEIELDPIWRYFALNQGRKKYPELDALMPGKPADAVICSVCNGTGEIKFNNQTLFCSCGGSGWILKTD